MSDIEDIYNEITDDGILFFNYSDIDAGAASVQNEYGAAIFVNERLIETTAEEKYAVIHEQAHLATHALHSVESSPEEIAKDEYQADKYAVFRYLPIRKLKRAFWFGDGDIERAAEYLNFPVRFVERAIYIYKCKGML